jgi:hypothetical protein
MMTDFTQEEVFALSDAKRSKVSKLSSIIADNNANSSVQKEQPCFSITAVLAHHSRQ